MQKLSEKLKNTPRNASLVPCSVNSQLNKEETLSVESIVLTDNNPEVNLSQHAERLKVKVYVISKEGNPIMPCSCAKAKHLLKEGKAKVIKRSPFAIQLNFECENQVQDVTLGIDTGFEFIGFSAVSEREELIAGTLKLDGKTKERLNDKRMYRRIKRNKLWYRKPRFNNRKKVKDWLPPSIERRYQTHLTLIEKIKKMLPITQVIVEVAKFDIQKLENSEIQGEEYQQGTLYGYQNTVSYLKTVQKNICPFCKRKLESGESKATHHRFMRSDSRRTDRIEGLILFHKKCHVRLHEQKREKEFQNIKIGKYQPSIFMSIINKRFWKDIPDLKVTYGNVTFVDRNNLGLAKSHTNDAFVIAKGNSQTRVKSFEIIQKHRNNRILQRQRRGYKPSIRRSRSIIQPLDLIWIKGIKYISKGMNGYGRYVYVDIGENKTSLNMKLVEKYFSQGSLSFSLKN